MFINLPQLNQEKEEHFCMLTKTYVDKNIK